MAATARWFGPGGRFTKRPYRVRPYQAHINTGTLQVRYGVPRRRNGVGRESGSPLTTPRTACELARRTLHEASLRETSAVV